MNPGLGFALTMISAALAGTFSLPMKKTTGWEWENVWLVFGVVALIIAPWTVALITVPHLLGVYHDSGIRAVAMTALFGVGWGLGSICFGRSISLIGMGLTYAIAEGLDAALGSFVPMATDPQTFLTRKGAIITAGVLVLVVGVAVSAIAGSRRDAALKANSVVGANAHERKYSGQFVKGLTIAFLSGIFNPMLNYAFFFGDRIKAVAETAGASTAAATDAIWPVALLGGSIANIAYCSILLTRNRRWPDYRKPGTGSHWFLAALMGVLWLAGQPIYGRAAVMMGSLGASIGWPTCVGGAILISNFWGVATGEWRSSAGRPIRTMYAGVAILLLAIAIIGYGNSLPA